MLYISQILQDPKIVKYEPKKVEVLYISQILQDPKTYKYHIIFFIIFSASGTSDVASSRLSASKVK